MKMPFSFGRSRLSAWAVAAAFLAAVFFLLSLFLPRLLTRNYDAKTLHSLRGKAESIKREFAILEWSLQRRLGLLLSSPLPLQTEAIFDRFQRSRIDPDIEGAAYYNAQGELAVWLGNIIDFRPVNPGASLVVRSKASIYLIASRRVRNSETILVTRLLAFRPQLRAPYLDEYHFLSPKLQSNCQIDYWDYREDVSGFESFFARHQDEYIGQQRGQGAAQQLFFPLRNDRKEIVATITISSPPLVSVRAEKREQFLFVSLILCIVALILYGAVLAGALLQPAGNKLALGAVLFLVLLLLRLIFFPLSGMEKLRSLPIFSPSQAGFLSLGGLTRSPADIFLTAIFVALVLGGVSAALSDPRISRQRIRGFPAAWLAGGLLIFAPPVMFCIFHGFLSRLVANSNVHLLHFSGNPSFLLLHSGLSLLLISLLLLALSSFRAAHCVLPSLGKSAIALSLAIIFVGLAFSRGRLFPQFAVQVLLSAVLFFGARKTELPKRGAAYVGGLLLGVLFVYAGIAPESSAHLRSLVRHSLRHTIESQEIWADFLLRQSVVEIEKRRTAIVSFLRNPDQSPLARSLWENTLVARLNWYSTLEVLGPEGEILSRFSLNIPQLSQPELALEVSRSWTFSRLTVPSLGKDREFILGYKDWFEKDRYLGRLTFFLTLDPEILPFLYSANPYFELLRIRSMPSLSHLGIGLAIFDPTGRLVFNPNRISSGLSPEIIDRVSVSAESVWASFTDRGKRFDAYDFLYQGKIYSLFFPHRGLMTTAVDFIKLSLFSLGVAALLFLLIPSLWQKKRIQNVFWSFASRVYAAFIAIMLISLSVFSVFSHRFFHRLFIQRFIEKAEIHASFARTIMHDFYSLQQEEMSPVIPPTDEFVLWISSAIGNDINLYREGRLVTSSRREFFDWGLLPEVVDGEIFYRISHDNKPFYTQRQKIGSYSFQSLTIPYTIGRSPYLISLPFPFEEQEISRATEELVEFLIFVAVFFIGIAFLFARGMGRMIIAPIEKLLIGTREVSQGNLDITIAHRSRDEMKTLVDGFNAMIRDLKKHEQEIAELSRKAAWAQMAQKVAHEIKNPLTPIRLSAEHILRVYEDGSADFGQALKESASYIISEVENLRRIAQEFLELSRETALRKERFDLRNLIREVTAPYQKMLSDRVRLREICEGQDFSIQADRSKLKIAIRNVVINAVEAIRGQGEIEVRLVRDRSAIHLSIRDTGTGMSPDIIDRIFDPYFSTKDVGTGLGLPIAKRIIEDHGGTIRAESEVGRGTTIQIMLPVEVDEPDPA